MFSYAPIVLAILALVFGTLQLHLHTTISILGALSDKLEINLWKKEHPDRV